MRPLTSFQSGPSLSLGWNGEEFKTTSICDECLQGDEINWWRATVFFSPLRTDTEAIAIAETTLGKNVDTDTREFYENQVLGLLRVKVQLYFQLLACIVNALAEGIKQVPWSLDTHVTHVIVYDSLWNKT